MEAIKKNINPIKATLPVDPRIDSPQIKVVYPAPPMILKDLPEQEPTPPPTTPTQQTAPVQQETPVGQTTANTTNNTNPAQNWQETIKQNSMLFIIVGLLALGLGFILGKNKG